MIKIEITDPHLMDKRTLRNVGVFLFAMAGDTIGLPPEKEEKAGSTWRSAFEADETHRQDELNETKPSSTIDINGYGEREIKQAETLDIEEELIPVSPERIFIPDNPPSRDIDGVEWNADLHSRTKTKTVDGRWKKKKVFGKEAPSEPIAPPPPPPAYSKLFRFYRHDRITTATTQCQGI